VTVAPCFGYQWAAEKISAEEIEELGIDLTCLRVAACGAEPIHPSVLERFADQFAGSGFRREVFYPCYGLAESTLMVTGTDRGDSLDHFEHLPGPITATISRGKLANDLADDPTSPDDAQTVVSCGVVAKDTQVCIVDPKTNQSLGDNRIGEIRVHSPSVAAGYWNDDDRTRKVFGESICGGARGFLHTGDLGFLRNGQLYVTGRIKDLIIIGGQNYYPQDIERTVAAADTMLVNLSGAAFSIQQDVGEQLVIVHEVPRSFKTEDADQIIRSVRLAVANTHDLTAQEIVLIRPASLPRTSSGKIQRNGCRKRFLEDGFEPVYRWRHADQLDPELFPDIGHLIARTSSRSLLRQKIEMTLLKWLQRFTDAGPVGSDQSFAELGVDSLMAVELSQQLERWLGVRLSPVAAWSYPTPAGLAEHLTALVAGQPESITDPVDPVRDEFEDLLAQIDSLNEDEVDDLLRQTSSQQQ
jgi:acyl carrier protein